MLRKLTVRNPTTPLWMLAPVPNRLPQPIDGVCVAAGVFANDAARELVPIPGFPRLRYHSLLAETGESIKRFREFVVFHGNYVYPEYVVAYKRQSK
jgi:hypothetical protein